MSDFTDSLKTLIGKIQANSSAFGIDTSNEKVKSEGYALALSTITNTPWEAAFSPEQSKYIVYPRNVDAARTWFSTQTAKKSTVSIQWWSMVAPVVYKKALPIAAGVFVAGFIAAKALK